MAPSPAALQWADSAAASGDASAGSIPPAAWRDLGAAATPQGQAQFSRRLLLAAWQFLDRTHGGGAAAAAETGSPSSAMAALVRSARASLGHEGGAGSEGSGRRHAASGRGADAGAMAGLSQQQLTRHQQQRGLLLLQRLLLHALLHAQPEAAQQAAAQAAQLLPALLADVASEAAGSDERQAAAARMQLQLGAVVYAYRSVASRARAQAQQEQLLPLQLQQRLGACEAAANAVVDAAPWAFGVQPSPASGQPGVGEPQPPQGQQQQRKPRLVQELLPLLSPTVVVAAACSALLFMRHTAQLHEGAVAALQTELQAAAQQERQLASMADERRRQCLGALLATDRLRRAAVRQAAEEAAQLRQRAWRDLRRALTCGRGLWADDAPEEGACCAAVSPSLLQLRDTQAGLRRITPPRMLLNALSPAFHRAALEAGCR